MIEYYVETPTQGFYFDRIHINTSYNPTMMRNILSVSELKKGCASLKIRKTTDKAVELGSKSRIEMIAPSKEALELLRKVMQENLSYFITKIEITKDIFVEGSAEDAERKVMKKTSTLRRKNSPKFFRFNAALRRLSNKARSYGKGLFTDWTYYYGYENYQFVIYARWSKILLPKNISCPCVHEEWRFISRSKIHKIAGIKTLDDLIHFDFETFFKKQERLFVHEHVKVDEFSKWLVGLERKKNLDYKEQMQVDLVFQQFTSKYGMFNSAVLVHDIALTKSEINKARGPKTREQQRILNTNYNRFLIRLDQTGEEE
jgi:hypothetical protein